MTPMPTRNSEVLSTFVAYCIAHPDERFWQAIRNFSGKAFVFAGEDPDDLQDTFYWEGKDE